MKTRLARLVNGLRASIIGSDVDTLRVKTDDGANLALRHYRPEPDAPFNDSSQPVLMMPPMLCNFNIYDVHTPKGKAGWSSLPEHLPGWAGNDERIRHDPMLLYSMAYYLYSLGYDVWMFNYRGQGRGRYRSCGPLRSDVDHYAIYDLKAAIVKVRELTGRRPVHLGLSLGGMTGLVYFQGVHHVPGPSRKVESDPQLVKERNAGTGPQAARGFVNLDGPRLPYSFGYVNLPSVARIMWYVTAVPVYYNLRFASRLIPRALGRPAILLWSLVWKLGELLPPFFYEMIAVLLSVNPANMDPDVLAYTGRYAADGVSAHLIRQAIDAYRCGKLRESYHHMNRGGRKIFPGQEESDGLYYYSDNMEKISLPSIFLADATLDITDPGEIRKCFDLKKRHPLDEFHLMPGTAHVDLLVGLRAPYETFPTIGTWLEKLGSDWGQESCF